MGGNRPPKNEQKMEADMTALTNSIDIHVTTRRALDERLEEAVNKLQQLAMHTRTHGIVVARNKPGHYTAALSDQVPFGVTREIMR